MWDLHGDVNPLSGVPGKFYTTNREEDFRLLLKELLVMKKSQSEETRPAEFGWYELPPVDGNTGRCMSCNGIVNGVPPLACECERAK